MPSSTLPGNTYMGDGQRTTSEMQDALDQVATWLNAAQAELDALTGTTFGEAAVRGVGTGSSDLVQTSQLDTRLGTSGNLNIVNIASSIADGSFDPENATLVWSGSDNQVPVASLSDSSPGIYLVKASNEYFSIVKGPQERNIRGSSWANNSGSAEVLIKSLSLQVDPGGWAFRVDKLSIGLTAQQVTNSKDTITEIYKV